MNLVFTVCKVVVVAGEGVRISTHACVPAYLVAGIDVCPGSHEQLHHLVGLTVQAVVQGSASFLEAAHHELKA